MRISPGLASIEPAGGTPVRDAVTRDHRLRSGPAPGVRAAGRRAVCQFLPPALRSRSIAGAVRAGPGAQRAGRVPRPVRGRRGQSFRTSSGPAHGAAFESLRQYRGAGRPPAGVGGARADGRIGRAAGSVRRDRFVNVGIGGSDLGPRLATEALQDFATGRFRLHFINNADAHPTARLVRALDGKTAVILVSKPSGRRRLYSMAASCAIGWRPTNGCTRSPPTSAGQPPSGWRRRASCRCGIGSAGAIRCGPRSVSRWRWRSAWMASRPCSTAPRPWTRTCSSPCRKRTWRFGTR